MLAGIYTILPLQSPLDILSTTLHPSSAPIPVFGPSSHPTPVITPSSSKRPTRISEYLSRLPLRLTFQRGDNRTIFLIREYDCGFLGLRNGVVPGFSNIWGEERGIWGLRFVHLVRILFLFSLKYYSHCSRYWAVVQQYTIPTSSLNHGLNLSTHSYLRSQSTTTVMTRKNRPLLH
jgi:hypothetical protein